MNLLDMARDIAASDSVWDSASAMQIPSLIKALAAVLGALAAWIIIKRILKSAERRVKGSERIRVNEQVFLLIRKAAAYILIFTTGTYLIRLFSFTYIENGFFAILILLLASPAKELVHVLIEYLHANVAGKTDTDVDDIVFDLLNKFAGLIIYATAIVIALDILGINVMPFIAGAGVAGIAIGFAAKETLSNLIAGVSLIVDRPFEVGDRIEVWSAPANSATWGDVIEIGLRATKIRTTDNIVIIIPNNEIMQRDIVNYTTVSSMIRVRVNVGIAYDADLQKAKQVILEVAGNADWIAGEPAPKIVVRNFGASSVDLQVRVWIKNARRRMDTISYLTDEIKTAFDLHGIEIPYPKRDITISRGPLVESPETASQKKNQTSD